MPLLDLDVQMVIAEDQTFTKVCRFYTLEDVVLVTNTEEDLIEKVKNKDYGDLPCASCVESKDCANQK